MAADLLPCPCCAGPATLHGRGDENWISCEGCGCQSGTYDLVQAAIAWNRRGGEAEAPDAAARRLAQAAAHAAAEAAAELLRFAREGEWLNSTFHPDTEPLEKLADAARMTIEALPPGEKSSDHHRLHEALGNFLEGWA